MRPVQAARVQLMPSASSSGRVRLVQADAPSSGRGSLRESSSKPSSSAAMSGIRKVGSMRQKGRVECVERSGWVVEWAEWGCKWAARHVCTFMKMRGSACASEQVEINNIPQLDTMPL